MPLIFESWEEYVALTGASRMLGPNTLRAVQLQTTLQTIMQVEFNRRELEEGIRELRNLGFSELWTPRSRPSRDKLDDGYQAALKALRASQELMLCYSRLASDDCSYGIKHQSDLPDHWERLVDQGSAGGELKQFYMDAKEMSAGLSRLIENESQLILEHLNLPAHLISDFRLSRDLFSAGFDEVGLFLAGRGIERLLRDIAQSSSIRFIIGNQKVPAKDARFFDLIEGLSRIGWEDREDALIDPETKSLLHYVRNCRNAQAHPPSGEYLSVAPRETAIIIARSAQRIWDTSASTAAELAPKELTKNW